MTTSSSVNAESLLAIDVGSVNTRAVLFDVVEGRYRFLAMGSAPSTAEKPYSDVLEGVRTALDDLQEISGRTLVNNEQLIIPSQSDGSGVDKCVATISAGPAIKTLVVGLLEDISVRSAQNLTATTYAQVVDTLSLNDRRRASARLDAVLRLHPDLVVIAGGTEGGASQSVLKLLETVGLASYLMPKEQRPEVLFAGNQSLAEEVKASLSSMVSLQIAPNIRPSLEKEQLLPAQNVLSAAYRSVRSRQMRGISDLNTWSGGHLMPTATAFARLVRYSNQNSTANKKGYLGIDVGASSVTMAAAYAGDVHLSVQTRLGLGESLPGILDTCSAEDILCWLPFDYSEEELVNYIYNKAAYPASVPVTKDALAIEQALTVQLIKAAARKLLEILPENFPGYTPGRLPVLEPIILSGAVFSNAPSHGQIISTLLNALQPVGVTTIALDSNNIASALGAAAEINPLLTVQAADSYNFTNLCTVVSPVGKAAPGTPVLRVRVKYPDGNESMTEVKYGTIEVISLPVGQAVVLQLQPLHRFDIEMGGPGWGGGVKIVGGSLGLVVDARGRPLALSQDAGRRQEMLKKWLWTFGS